jgi:hypothetical protein
MGRETEQASERKCNSKCMHRGVNYKNLGRPEPVKTERFLPTIHAAKHAERVVELHVAREDDERQLLPLPYLLLGLQQVTAESSTATARAAVSAAGLPGAPQGTWLPRRGRRRDRGGRARRCVVRVSTCSAARRGESTPSPAWQGQVPVRVGEAGEAAPQRSAARVSACSAVRATSDSRKALVRVGEAREAAPAQRGTRLGLQHIEGDEGLVEAPVYISGAEETLEQAAVKRGWGIRGLTAQRLLHLRVVEQLRERRQHAHDLRGDRRDGGHELRWRAGVVPVARSRSTPFLRYSSARYPVSSSTSTGSNGTRNSRGNTACGSTYCCWPP